MMLRIAFTVLPIVAGLDKFFHVLGNWDDYLAPVIASSLPVTAHQFMMIVGLVEILAGVLAAVVPQIAGYVIMAWLWGVVVNLLLHADYYDVALRDFGLSLGALTLARLTQLLQGVRAGADYGTTTTETVHEYAEPPH